MFINRYVDTFEKKDESIFKNGSHNKKWCLAIIDGFNNDMEKLNGITLLFKAADENRIKLLTECYHKFFCESLNIMMSGDESSLLLSTLQKAASSFDTALSKNKATEVLLNSMKKMIKI
jgi:hypothetical protein